MGIFDLCRTTSTFLGIILSSVLLKPVGRALTAAEEHIEISTIAANIVNLYAFPPKLAAQISTDIYRLLTILATIRVGRRSMKTAYHPEQTCFICLQEEHQSDFR